MQLDEVVHSEGLREYTVRPQRQPTVTVIDLLLILLVVLSFSSDWLSAPFRSPHVSLAPEPVLATHDPPASIVSYGPEESHSIGFCHILFLWLSPLFGQGLQTQTSLCQDALNMWQTASTWLFASIPLLPWIPVDQLCGLFLWITSLLSRLDVRIGIAALVVPHVLAKMTLVTSESVLVFRDMGIQLHTRCWGGFVSTTRFIPVSKILTVIINEGITLFQVKFYLAILVDGEDEMTVAFSKTLPRLHIIERVYVNIRETLIYQ
ncbi:hypothetical protein BASA50_006073 [Batrachochytrium salamandrivorans]|uniref:Phosphatidylinositol N-acetylglucosaminyltransferase subunit H conserved domain-containing protein n=1 Tax=Batrachochytrium salamandrivorans TaxID=1357716 RepID=A0ABQ8FAS6_9FUNG|nr:hypothetical protein BASA50_006073 [Batrachochytrium salamandrivorans]KAH6600912.1 hypothetical protein BASA61_002124 [Batrachochytrium salamandrivorans]KAH9274371.1 hypothetical protein BASA83_003369 [Batrachochytrium salamandrivorans]KAJ1328443.1 hypothetical protein BSLG_010175 [Batrachochytrium salamandrivorans]